MGYGAPVFCAEQPADHSQNAKVEPPAAVAAANGPEDELPVLALTDQLFQQMHSNKAEDVWEAVNRLVRLGKSEGNRIQPRLEEQLSAKEPRVQLACARALCQLNAPEHAIPLLSELVQNGEAPEIRRLAANVIGLTTCLYGDENITRALVAALKKEKDDATKVSLARSLWRVATRNDGRDALFEILRQSTDKSLRDEAALVLAENGFLNSPDVRLRLLNLYAEPTEQGERAFNLLRRAEDDYSRPADPKMSQGEHLIRELLNTIHGAYPDESKYDVDKLFEDAAKGMIAGLDPFSQYMDRSEVKATQEMLQQDYDGIGAYVGIKDGQFIITSPIYGSPADRAGLRARDAIVEVDGQKTSSLLDKGGINAVICKLKGPPGSSVTVKYYRRGFTKALEVAIKRENIRVESVFSTMLPGGVAYIRLTRFGERSSDEMQAALDDLMKEKKARALILDLRDNPGGLLRSGVDIADKFLAGDKLIVYSEGNKEFAPRKDYRSTGSAEDESFPMVALVGSGSASAAEIVAGALQDHKRALLIGEKTYGKGSVQQIMPLKSTDRQTQLRLTIAKYYLPSGRCIHEKGIDVDIEVKPREIHSWVIESLIDLRKNNVFEDYIRKTWDANKDAYMKLAIYDEGKAENWPGFEDFYKTLNTRLDKDDVRAELRVVARRRVQDEQKKELSVDLEEDDVLQRGVLEILKKLKLDPLTIAEYKTLPEKFKSDPAQQGAMLPDNGGINP